MKPRVVCAGVIVADHITAPIERMPGAGELVLADDCFLTIGGGASNVSIDLARQEVPAAVAGCLGDDPFGDFARGVFERAGLDGRGLVTTREAPTSQTLIVNVRGEDRRFIHLPGANAVYRPEDVTDELLEGAEILFLGYLFLLERWTPEATASLFRRARARGIRTVLDVVTPGARDYAGALRVVLPEVDVFLPNHDEGRLMTGLEDPRAQAARFREWGAGTVVVKRGGAGSITMTAGRELEAGVFPATFIDGTGSGDAFDAGFIRGMIEGATLERCLELGSALGSSCVRAVGATAGVFTRAEVDRFLAEQRLPITER
jgi:sugar/nucleoside kinase (ribokinase family)